MAQHVTKQPNGKYAVFSSVVDHFILYDATREEIMEHFRSEAVADSERLTSRSLDRADALDGQRLNDDLHMVAMIHGLSESDKYRALLSGAKDDPEHHR